MTPPRCPACLVGFDTDGDGDCHICAGLAIDKIVAIRRRIRELDPPLPVPLVRLGKGAPKGVSAPRWHWVENERWQLQDNLAVLGKVYASELAERKGWFYWVAAAWGSGINGQCAGYCSTEEKAKEAVENAVLEPL